MSNYEATKYDFDGANLTGIEGVPTATIVPWSTAVVPTGYLECAGAAVSRTTYAALFAVVSTTYGVGDGSLTFNLPDLQDRVPLSKSNTKNVGQAAGAATVAATGNVGGSTANATLSEAQLAAHTHTLLQGYMGNPGQSSTRWDRSPVQSCQYTAPQTTSDGVAQTGADGGHDHNMSATFTGDATSVLQPYLTVMYIIKT